MASAYQGVWSWYLANREAAYDYNQRAEQNRTKAAKEVATRCIVPFAPADIVGMCLAHEIKAQREKNKSYEDLDAQQEMAWWTRIMGIVGLVGVPLSILGLYALWRSLRQTMQAISSDREVGHAQVRAYITVAPEMPDDIRAGHNPTVEIKIKNTGQSPSYFTKYMAHMEVAQHPINTDDDRFLFPHPDVMEQVGITVPSQGDFGAEAKCKTPLTIEDCKSAMQATERRLYLACIVYYTDVFKQPRVTKFCAYLDDSGKPLFDQKGRTIKAYTWAVAPINNEAT